LVKETDMVELLARCLNSLYARVTPRDASLAEPEFLYPSRPITGFFAGLTPEQQNAALGYRGDENHGDPAYAYKSR
jgi:hypothetical protein